MEYLKNYVKIIHQSQLPALSMKFMEDVISYDNT